MRPTLYLDVDGVVLPLGRGAWAADRVRVGPFYVHLPRGLDRLVASLHESFEIVWATSWCEEANQEVGPLLGLPWLPALDVTAHWRKLELVRAHAGNERPFAWIDDRLGPEAWAWAGGRPGRSLLLRPDSARGMTPGHVEDLLGFARSCTAC